MPRPKSLILPMEITTAARSHNCRHNDRHRIAMGQQRLAVTVDGDKHHYCLECAKIFLTKDITRLNELLETVDQAFAPV